MKNSDFAASNFCDRCGKNEDRVGPRNQRLESIRKKTWDSQSLNMLMKFNL